MGLTDGTVFLIDVSFVTAVLEFKIASFVLSETDCQVSQ